MHLLWRVHAVDFDNAGCFLSVTTKHTVAATDIQSITRCAASVWEGTRSWFQYVSCVNSDVACHPPVEVGWTTRPLVLGGSGSLFPRRKCPRNAACWMKGSAVLWGAVLSVCVREARRKQITHLQGPERG